MMIKMTTMTSMITMIMMVMIFCLRSSGRKTGDEVGPLCSDTKTRKVKYVVMKWTSPLEGIKRVPAMLSRG